MGDVLRVLATCNDVVLQHLMHDRLVLEACENVHLHWRSLRVEMSLTDAARLVDLGWRFSKIVSLLEGRVVSIPLTAICPYDPIHQRVDDENYDNGSVEDTAAHKADVAWMVEQMNAGRRTWPIAVRPGWAGRFSRIEYRQPTHIWQRLDGFKRYMAHKALGRPTIECFVVAEDRPGCQHGHRPFLDEGEELPHGFDKDFFVQVPEQLSELDAEKQRYRTNEVELLRNGTVHVHLGDVRLEFERAEFVAFARLIQSAAATL